MKTEVTFPEQPLHTRRGIMIKGIAGAVGLAGFGSKAGVVLASVPGVTHGETPGAEEGPFWVDGQVQRIDMRPDSTTGVYPAGLPLYLGLTVSQLSDTAPYTIKPLVGARVDMWNANAQGVYSDESSESTVGTNYQRGYQVTNAHGVVNILTNYSGWYSGRTPHVHIRIRTYNGTTVTYNYCTQLFFDDTITAQVFASSSAYARTQTRDAYNNTDRVYNGSGTNGSPATEVGDYLLMRLADDATHAVASFHIVLDLSDTTNADPTNGVETTTPTGTTPTGTPPSGTSPTGTPPTGTPPTGTVPTVKPAVKSSSTSRVKSGSNRKP